MEPLRIAGAPVVVRDGIVDVEAVHAAIRARVELRARGGLPVSEVEVEAAKRERLAPLDDWNLPRATLEAMWPPALRPWNLDDDFPIRSHRPGLGSAIVAVKRLARSLARLLGRPLVSQQAEINRALALLALTLADEAARERLRTRALEARLARVGTLVREARGEVEPLLVFADDPAGGEARD